MASLDIKTHGILVALSSLLWIMVYKLLNDKLVLCLLPEAVREYVKHTKETDPNFRRLSIANGTAFIHAFLVSPICIICGIQLMAEDPWEGESNVIEVLAILILGYFVWDVLICVLDVTKYGVTFLLHGLLSLIGLYVQVASARCRMLGFVAMFAASEISTPFLHCRWYCIKAKQTDTAYFRWANFLFLLSFFLMRIMYMPIFVFPLFWKDCVELRYLHNMSIYRRLLQCVMSMAWTLLNYYWGSFLLYSQMKQIFNGPKIKPTQRDSVAAKETTPSTS